MLKDTLNSIFGDSEESRIIQEVSDATMSSVPSTAPEAKMKMMLFDALKCRLSNVYFLICRNIHILQREFQQSYDTQYTRLVKLGRPSKDAIEAEIRTLQPNYASAIQKVQDLEDVKEFISLQMRCIDACKTTAMRVLEDSRRID